MGLCGLHVKLLTAFAAQLDVDAANSPGQSKCVFSICVLAQLLSTRLATTWHAASSECSVLPETLQLTTQLGVL